MIDLQNGERGGPTYVYADRALIEEDQVRPVTNEDIGIKTLREPPLEDADGLPPIDILAVHGIGAHPDDTWMSKVNRADESQGYVNWLKDEHMLPEAVPNARVMRYGYHSSWFGADAIRTQITTVAQRMLHALVEYREDDPHRKLIFITHCYGGLLVLQALLNAFRYPDDCIGLAESTVGIVFLGTPFRGAGGLSQSEMLEAALREHDPEQIQIDTFHLVQPGNEFLQQLLDDFSRTILGHARRPAVACFYEIKESNVGRVVGGEERKRCVVSEASGCLDLGPMTRKYSMWRDHFSINKFNKPGDEDYRVIRRVVRFMASHDRDSLPIPSPGHTHGFGPGTNLLPGSRATTWNTHDQSLGTADALTHRDTWPSPPRKDTFLSDAQPPAALQAPPHSSFSHQWQSAYENVRHNTPEALNLLELWSFLDRHILTYEVIEPLKGLSPTQASFFPEWLRLVVRDKNRFNEMLRTLERFNLIEYDEAKRQYLVPEDVQEQFWGTILSKGERQVTTDWWTAARLIGLQASTDFFNTDHWRIQRRLLPHTLQLYNRMQSCRFENANTNTPTMQNRDSNANTLLWLGKVVGDMLRLDTAMEYLQQGLRECEASNTPTSFAVSIELNLEIANIFVQKMMYAEATTACDQILEDCEVQQNPENLLRRTTILSKALRDQGDRGAAENMLRETYVRHFGPMNDPVIENWPQLNALMRLSILDARLHKAPQSRTLVKGLIRKLREALGAGHAITLEAYNSLADIERYLGDYSEAEMLYRRVITGFANMLGVDHPWSWGVAQALAQLYHIQKKLPEAEMQYKNALKGVEQTSEGCWVQYFLICIADVYRDQGRFDEARGMYKQVIEKDVGKPDSQNEWKRVAEKKLTKIGPAPQRSSAAA